MENLMKTKVFLDEFKGHRLFAIWEVDDAETKVGDFPLFSVGARKAFSLYKHLTEFKDYVDIMRFQVEKKGKQE